MKYENIIISPHIDDAFFSLGGLLLKNKRKPQKVVDVFATSDYTISGRANVKDTTRMRRSEEAKNAKKVGAEVEFLPFSDAGSGNASKRTYAALKSRLKKYLGLGKRVFFPLGIGGHGDHVLVSKIGVELAQETGNRNVYFYEDLPYAVRTSRLFPIAGRLLGFKSRDAFPLINTKTNARHLEHAYVSFPCGSKLEMCRAYKSQINKKILVAISAYSRMLGSGIACRERIWRIKNRDYLESLLKRGTGTKK